MTMNKRLARLKDAKTNEIKLVMTEMDLVAKRIKELEGKYEKLSNELGRLREERAAISKVMSMEAR